VSALLSDAAVVLSASTAASMCAKATVAIGLALIGARVAQKSRAAVRHVVLAAAFAVLLCLPAASFVAPSIHVAVPVAAQPSVATQASTILVDDAGVQSTPTPGDGARAVARKPRALSVATLLFAAWAMGALVFLTPVLAGLWQVRALWRSALPWRDGQSVLTPLARAAGISRRVDVVLHEATPGPMTCGIVHPAIVLPLDAASWPHEQLTRAIVHELEHIRRADWITHGVARAVCACYWFHPLVWIAWRQLALEAERACDDAVLALGDATDYADQLVVLAQQLSATTTSPLLAMANRADLATRVGAVLDSRQRRGRAGLACVSMGCAIAAMLVVTISPLQIVAAAQSSATPGGPKFDVISVKRCANTPAPTPRGSGTGGGAARGAGPGGSSPISHGRFSVDCSTVERLISTAYVLNGDPLLNNFPRTGDSSWYEGGPDWIGSEKYTIEATSENTTDRQVVMGPMLRALLEDRFKLTLHRETKDAPMYALTVAPGGLKIQPSVPGEPGACVVRDPNTEPVPEILYCGKVAIEGDSRQLILTMGGATVPAFVNLLSTLMDRRVIDKTGVPASSRFNIHLRFAPDEHLPGAGQRNFMPAEFPEPPSGVSPILRALDQQLGVKIESTHGPQGLLVIDHLERPDPDAPAAAAPRPGREKQP
jgi:uncharacterized protein (TIGR03435 family)